MLKKISVLTLPTILVLAIVSELVFRFVIPASEQPLTVFDHRYGILKYDVNGPRDGVYTIGPTANPSAHWHVNNEGWISAIDYQVNRSRNEPLIAVIGDSYVEAFQVDTDKSVGAVLRSLVNNKADVYTFGMSGAALSEYLQIGRYVQARFRPDIFVINIVHNDFDESVRELLPRPQFMQLTMVGGTLREIPPTPYVPNGTRRAVRRVSATARWLVQNCHAEALPAHIAYMLNRGSYIGNTYATAVDTNRPVITAAVNRLVHDIRALNPKARVVFVMDAVRTDIYAGRSSGRLSWLTTQMRDSSRAAGCEFVDLTPAFTEFWHRTHEPLENTSDYHWNEAGHRIAATALYAKLVADGAIQ